MFLSALALFVTASVPHHLFPDEELMEIAFELLDRSRSMYSDYPEIYRHTWSHRVEGPCPDFIYGPGGSDTNLYGTPCSTFQFESKPWEPPVPCALYTIHQNLCYNAPREPGKKASLELSWRISLVAMGVTWDVTINAQGIKHDILITEYRKRSQKVQIAPGIYVRKDFLQPDKIHHCAVKPTGSYTIETHDLDVWDMGMAALASMMYDCVPHQERCGTYSWKYTSKPGEIINDLMSGDAAELLPGDEQIIITPMVGLKYCGEYDYRDFYLMMTFREPPTPSWMAGGPPLEVWTFAAGGRDESESTNAATDPNSQAEHGRMAGVQEKLREEGFQGAFNQDADLQDALDSQEEMEDNTFAKGTILGDQALTLMDMLAENPDNQNLLEMFIEFVGPHLDHIDFLNDTEVEFNPLYPHCEDPAVEGTLPFFGLHYFQDPPYPCKFCLYHDLIVDEPMSSWSHSRLIDIRWVWEKIHDFEEGNLYERAYAFIRQVIFPMPGQARRSMTGLQNMLGDRIDEYTHGGQIESLHVQELEGQPNPDTSNSIRSGDGGADTPEFFRVGYEQCMDPSWTIHYLLLYREISDVFNSPCGEKLWGVLPPQ